MQNPGANAFLSDGVAPFRQMLERHIRDHRDQPKAEQSEHEEDDELHLVLELGGVQQRADPRHQAADEAGDDRQRRNDPSPTLVHAMGVA